MLQGRRSGEAAGKKGRNGTKRKGGEKREVKTREREGDTHRTNLFKLFFGDSFLLRTFFRLFRYILDRDQREGNDSSDIPYNDDSGDSKDQ